MVREETSIAEKIIKNIPDENIVLNKKFNGRKPNIWFKDFSFTVEVDEGDHEDYDTDDEKEREEQNFKTIRCNPNDPVFDINKFLGERNSYVTKLTRKKAVNEVINKIAEEFEQNAQFAELKSQDL